MGRIEIIKSFFAHSSKGLGSLTCTLTALPAQLCIYIRHFQVKKIQDIMKCHFLKRGHTIYSSSNKCQYQTKGNTYTYNQSCVCLIAHVQLLEFDECKH